MLLVVVLVDPRKEKAGKLKPTALQRQRSPEQKGGSEATTNLRSEAPEFVPGSEGKPWTSDRLLEGKPWMDAQYLGKI